MFVLLPSIRAPRVEQPPWRKAACGPDTQHPPWDPRTGLPTGQGGVGVGASPASRGAGSGGCTVLGLAHASTLSQGLNSKSGSCSPGMPPSGGAQLGPQGPPSRIPQDRTWVAWSRPQGRRGWASLQAPVPPGVLQGQQWGSRPVPAPAPYRTPAAAGTRHCRVPPDRSALLLPSRLEVRSLTPVPGLAGLRSG